MTDINSTAVALDYNLLTITHKINCFFFYTRCRLGVRVVATHQKAAACFIHHPNAGVCSVTPK